MPSDPTVAHPRNYEYCDAGISCDEREHYGWGWIDVMIELTANQPSYWSAATGLPYGTAPFWMLDPGRPPGRPDPEDSGHRIVRGYILAVAVDLWAEEINWNHLSGGAVIVNYEEETALEYGAWAMQAVAATALGERLLEPLSRLDLDGVEYESPPEKLLFEFLAVGSTALSSEAHTVTTDGELTLLPVQIDLRQDGLGPTTTKADFEIWNMNEWKFPGTRRCTTCWDQTWLSDFDVPNHFLRANLQTNKGKARIDGVASSICADNGLTSPDVPLLGISSRLLTYESTHASKMAANAGVGHGRLPVQQEAVLLIQTTKGSPFECICLNVFYSSLDLPLTPDRGLHLIRDLHHNVFA